MQKDAILGDILKKYGSQKECAKALGITEQAFSHALSRMSNRFIARLRNIGIIVYDDDQQNKVDSVNESVVIYQANRIMELEKEVEKLKLENVKLRVQSIPLIKKDKGASLK